MPGRKIKPHWMALHYLATGQGLLIWGGQEIARKYHTHTLKGHSHLSNSAVECASIYSGLRNKINKAPFMI